MRNIFRFFLSLVTAIVLFGCSDRLDDYYTAEELAGMKIHLQFPNYSKNLVKTRALADGESISKVTVIFYNSNDNCISQQELTPKASGSDYTITPSYPSGTSKVAVVTNATSDVDLTGTLSSTFLSTTPDIANPICWGTASVNDLLTGKATSISLLRMAAKVTVDVASSVSDFTLEGIEMCNTAKYGSIATTDPSTPNNNSKEDYSQTVGDLTTTGPLAFYETPEGKAYLIVKGKYNGTEGYYKVVMYDQNITTSNTELNLLRNHNYIVTIKSVNEAGYSTLDAAKAGLAENRMTVDIVDDNPPIVNMIACKDYELGVCDNQTTNGNAGTDKFNISVMTTYSESTSYTYSIASKPDWVTLGTATTTTYPTRSDAYGSLSSPGALSVIPVTVIANPTEDARTGTITVTAGDLTRTITITQEGYDFLGDDNRKVTFLDGTTEISTDYFGDFLPKKVSGVKAADNQGLARDHGLHFAAVKRNTYSYKIPHLKGDILENKDNSRIAITDEGEGKDYIVTLVNSDNDDLWVSLSAFKITNKDKVTITYPVYHTGVLHNITDKIANDWELGTEKEKRTGWFYYGVVEVTKGGNTYRLLDRNIGATNNGFYSPATQETKENEGAKGAYMVLTKKAIKTTESSSWYVYTAPKGVSSFKFILKSVSGADDTKKLTTKDQSASSDVYYKVNGSSASVTNDRPNFKDDGSTISVYVEASSAPYIYVWYNDANDKKQEPNGAWASTKAMSELSVNTALVGNEFMPSTYFQIPTESYVDDILPEKVEQRHTKTGEVYYCYVIKTTGDSKSRVQPAEVYIPVTGYYEGTSLRNENHANIWTCTRLSGYQGFSTSSPEFGFWFRYLDCHNSIEEITNMRFVNGSAGRYGSIYNAMPVRGIHKE